MNEHDQPPANGVDGQPVIDAVRSFITQTFYVPDDAPLDDEASLIERGVIDSTGVLELLGFLQQRYGIEAADAEVVPENFDSVGSLARFVERKLGS